MTAEDRKLIFEYCGWENQPLGCNDSNPNCGFDEATLLKCEDCESLVFTEFDGNDIVAAMNKMVERGEWGEFIDFIADSKTDHNLLSVSEWALFIANLMQPTRFFSLMAEWLRGKK